MATNHASSPTPIPAQVAEVLDPYPERLTSLGGVRQHTGLSATCIRKSTNHTKHSGRRHPFGASLLITIAAQGVLAAVIASQQISPLLGAAAAVAMLVCGLGLVLAEMIQVTGR